MYRDYQHWLMTLTFKAGIRVMVTSDIGDSAALIVAMYTWFTAKDWADHRSHLAMAGGADLRDSAVLIKPSVLRRIAAELPGIGWDRSAKVAQHFHSVIEMALSSEPDWEEIPGIGPKTAKAVCAVLRGEKVSTNNGFK
jgi:ERCC4-type nuclease